VENEMSRIDEKMGPKKLNSVMVRVFLRSLFIQCSLNFWRMQNLGFVFSTIPLVRKLGKNKQQVSNMLTRHLQFFNTHPYMSGSVIGSVLSLEEDFFEDGNCPEADKLKNALIGPYAAVGDSFFWGSLKPFSAIVGVALAIKGFLLAPLIFLLIYNPFHIWIRLKGFVEGYSKGREGVDFIRKTDLPRMYRKIRWLSVISLGILTYLASTALSYSSVFYFEVMEKVLILIVIGLVFFMIKKGISPLNILYGMTILFFLVS
jgi:PTS system mannose-specific IID component